MKDKLLLGIKSGNRVFQVFYHNLECTPSFNVYDSGKIFTLIFGKQVHARVEYKNTTFFGSATAHNIWYINMKNVGCIVDKHNERVRMSGQAKSKTNQEINLINSLDLELSLNNEQQKLFDYVIGKYSKLFNEIENKDLFIEKFKEDICETIFEDDIFDVDSEYIKDYITQCKSFFCNFINSEKDKKIIYQLLDLKRIIKNYPPLKRININLLKQYYKRFIDENDIDNYIDESIFYNREEMIQSVGEEIENMHFEYEKEVFNESLEERIEEIIGQEYHVLKNKEVLLGKVRGDFVFSNIPNEEELRACVNNRYQSLLNYNSIFDNCFNEYNSDEIIIELDEEKTQRFEEYEKKGVILEKVEMKEYELVYKIVMPYYNSYMFKKNSKRFKPSIEKIDSFIKYVNKIYTILEQNHFLIENDVKEFVINKSVDYSNIILEIKETD